MSAQICDERVNDQNILWVSTNIGTGHSFHGHEVSNCRLSVLRGNHGHKIRISIAMFANTHGMLRLLPATGGHKNKCDFVVYGCIQHGENGERMR